MPNMQMVCSMNYSCLFCLCIVIGLFQGRCSAIEDKDWITRPGTKFEYHYDSTRKHCDNAQNECQKHGANLASILSKEENEFITKDFVPLLNISMPLFKDYPWLGLVRQANTTDWKWRDNSATLTNLTYLLWMTGQPDETTLLPACSLLNIDLGKWYDAAASIDTTRGFICKRENLCLTKLCQNNGNCSRSVDGNYKCFCTSAHRGIHCDLENFCYSIECEHNSTCENTINDFRCNCTDNYHGRLCELEIPISRIAITGTYILFGLIILAFLLLIAVIVISICCCRRRNRNKRNASDPLNMKYTSFKRTTAPTRCSGASVEIAYDEIEIKNMTSAKSKEQKTQKRHNYVNTTVDRNANSDNQYEMYSFPNKDGNELISKNPGQSKKNYDDDNADYALETLPLNTDNKKKPNDNIEYSLETLPSNASRKAQNDNNQPEYGKQTSPLKPYYSKESAPLMKAITQEKGNTGGYDNVRISKNSDTGKYDNVEIKKASDVANSGTLNTKMLEQETKFVTNEIYSKT